MKKRKKPDPDETQTVNFVYTAPPMPDYFRDTPEAYKGGIFPAVMPLPSRGIADWIADKTWPIVGCVFLSAMCLLSYIAIYDVMGSPTSSPIPVVSRVAPIPANVRAASVRVRHYTDGACGSGIVIGDRLILTASHVVDGHSDVIVDVFSDDGHRSIRGRVVRRGFGIDLATVETFESLPASVDIGGRASTRLRSGQPLYCIGATMGHTPWNCTQGFFAGRGVPEIPEIATCWQMSAAGFFGNSGCGVYTADWELIGLVITGDSHCTTFFICAEEMAAFVEGGK